MLTISEARAALPEVLTRVADGEQITITRHGRPVAVVVRPDVIWSPPGAEAARDETVSLVRVLRERASRHGWSLKQELRAILDAAGHGTADTPLPPIRLATVRTSGGPPWSREDIYGDAGR